MRPLRSYQSDALRWCSNRMGIALFMEMRLGKSKVIIERLRDVKRILVIAPLSTLRTWEHELKIEGINSVAILRGTPEQRFIMGKQWNLINFEGLQTHPGALEYLWGAVVVDESSRLRNPKTKTSKTIIQAFENIPVKAVLSGMPAPETPLDYFQQFKFIHGEFLGFRNYWSFRNKACKNVWKWKWVLRRAFKDKILDYIHKNSFILSRKDAGIPDQKIRQTRYIQLDSKQKRLMEKAEKDFVLETNQQDIMTMYVPVVWTWLAQMAGGFVDGEFVFKAKMKELVDLLTGELSGQKVVVWFRFNQEIEQAEYELERKGVKCDSITGNNGEDVRWKSIRTFREGNVNVLLIQNRVGLYGLDLSVADTAIYYSNGFSLENRVQSEDRTINPVKKTPSLIIDLVVQDSIDEDILKALETKKKNSEMYLKLEIYKNMRRRVL